MTIERQIVERLRAAARPHRAGAVDGHSVSAMRVLGVTVPDLRVVVRDAAWALRELAKPDPSAVAGFLDETELAPRVVREVRAKLATGRKRR